MVVNKLTPFGFSECKDIIVGFEKKILDILTKYKVGKRDVDFIVDSIENIQVLISDMVKDTMPIIEKEKLERLQKENKKLYEENEKFRRKNVYLYIVIEAMKKRHDQGKSLYVLAQESGLEITALRRFERGSNLRIENLEAILLALGYTESEIEIMTEELR